MGSTETATLQTSVESTAVGGAIDNIVITNMGADYTSGDASVVITGDGTGAAASLTVNSNGNVTAITVTTPGSGYTKATVSIQQTTGSGTNAAFRAIIAPYSGHGAKVQQELFAHRVGITTSFDNDSRDLLTGNDYRQVGLLKNITKYNSTDLFNEATGSGDHVIGTLSPASYDTDDTITTSSNGTYRVTQKRDTTGNGTIDSIYLQEVDSDIASTDTLTNTTKDITGLTINSLTNPEFNAHSGELLYYDNRKPITRDSDQVETVKLIFTF